MDLEHEMLWIPLSLSVSRVVYSSEHTDVSEFSTCKVSFFKKMHLLIMEMSHK